VAPHTLVALALCTLIGVSLGLLGGGGSILAVPVLVYVARIEVHTAIGMSLAVVGATALVGALVLAGQGRVDLKAAAIFGGAGMLGAPIGATGTRAVEPKVLLILFASLMLTVGVLMIVAKGATARATRPAPVVAAAGFGIGLLTGFLGVGGGFLIVPALTLLAGLPIHRAIGTSLLVIAANSAAGLVAHAGRSGLPAGLTAALTVTAALGALVGVRLAGRLHPDRLRRAFALFVIAVGLAMLARFW
jgi:hypothetical protein